MKKIFGLFSAIAVLFAAASCQQETLPAVDMGDKVTATLNVSIPDAMKTKAFGDASGIQAVGVDYEIYKYNPETKAYDQLVLADNLKLDENLEGTLELKLIRFETYGVFFWASTSDAHKKDQALGLQKMTIDYAPNKENDAFAGRVLDINAETDLELPDVVLKRPFAQLNFATDDLGAGKNVTAGDLALKNMTVKVPGLATVYDNVTGLGTDAAEQTFSVTAANTDPITFDGVDYTHILMFYALPVGETATADLDTKITVTRGTETTDITVDWTGKSAMNNVPVSQNYRTNFYGSFLTADGTINVKVDQEFEYVGNTDINTGDTDATAKITAEKLLDQNTPDGTYNVTGKITAVEAGTAANTEKVTIDDKVTLTLDVPQTKADATVAETYYTVGEEITVKVVKEDGKVAETAEVVAYNPEEGEEPETPEQPVEPEGPVAATVAEFLAAAEDETMYKLTGVITSVTNTTYGNFYLKDATGEVLIYGLCSPEGVQKYWAESGAKVGDTITVQTVRTSFNGSPQGKNALFVELVPFVAQESEWGIVGDLTSWGNTDIKMYTTWKAADLFVAEGVEIASGAFKIRANNEWNDAKNYGFEVAGKAYADKYYSVITSGGSQNITPMEYGKYDVYFDLAKGRIALMTPGKEYADATDGGEPVVVVEGLTEHKWGVAGSFQGWDAPTAVEMVIDGDYAVAKNVTLENGAEFKFVADGAWTLSYGSACDVNVGETYTTYNNGGNMKFVGEAGAYNLYFSMVDAKFHMETYIAATTVEVVAKDLGYENAGLVEEPVKVDDNVTLTFEKGSASTAPAYYTSGEAIRLYQNGAIMNVTANGRKITSIEITFANKMYYLAADSGEFTEEADVRTWTGNAEAVKFTSTGTDKDHRAYISKVKVTYE